MKLKRYKFYFAPLAIIGAVLITIVSYQYGAHKTTVKVRSDLRYARQIIALNSLTRNVALKSDITNAVDCLYKLQDPLPGSIPFTNIAADIVDMNRKRDAQDIITYLRAKSGIDLGTNPADWIMHYGSDSCKDMERPFVTSNDLSTFQH
ncbi:MAG: hypothetical protein ACXWDN_02885 [Limisphaerales bacterium]